MSKVDALRALREARYAAQSGAGSSPTPRAASRQAAPPARRTPSEPAPAETGLCGHRNMSGRSCTRPTGHAEKNHRYG